MFFDIIVRLAVFYINNTASRQYNGQERRVYRCNRGLKGICIILVAVFETSGKARQGGVFIDNITGCIKWICIEKVHAGRLLYT